MLDLNRTLNVTLVTKKKLFVVFFVVVFFLFQNKSCELYTTVFMGTSKMSRVTARGNMWLGYLLDRKKHIKKHKHIYSAVVRLTLHKNFLHLLVFYPAFHFFMKLWIVPENRTQAVHFILHDTRNNKHVVVLDKISFHDGVRAVISLLAILIC